MRMHILTDLHSESPRCSHPSSILLEVAEKKSVILGSGAFLFWVIAKIAISCATWLTCSLSHCERQVALHAVRPSPLINPSIQTGRTTHTLTTYSNTKDELPLYNPQTVHCKARNIILSNTYYCSQVYSLHHALSKPDAVCFWQWAGADQQHMLRWKELPFANIHGFITLRAELHVCRLTGSV